MCRVMCIESANCLEKAFPSSSRLLNPANGFNKLFQTVNLNVTNDIQMNKILLHTHESPLPLIARRPFKARYARVAVDNQNPCSHVNLRLTLGKNSPRRIAPCNRGTESRGERRAKNGISGNKKLKSPHPPLLFRLPLLQNQTPLRPFNSEMNLQGG